MQLDPSPTCIDSRLFQMHVWIIEVVDNFLCLFFTNIHKATYFRKYTCRVSASTPSPKHLLFRWFVRFCTHAFKESIWKVTLSYLNHKRKSSNMNPPIRLLYFYTSAHGRGCVPQFLFRSKNDLRSVVLVYVVFPFNKRLSSTFPLCFCSPRRKKTKIQTCKFFILT